MCTATRKINENRETAVNVNEKCETAVNVNGNRKTAVYVKWQSQNGCERKWESRNGCERVRSSTNLLDTYVCMKTRDSHLFCKSQYIGISYIMLIKFHTYMPSYT